MERKKESLALSTASVLHQKRSPRRSVAVTLQKIIWASTVSDWLTGRVSPSGTKLTRAQATPCPDLAKADIAAASVAARKGAAFSSERRSRARLWNLSYRC